jgi:hypothetical protein
MPQYRVVRDFTIDPFTFKVGEAVAEAELSLFKQELVGSGCVVPVEDVPPAAPVTPVVAAKPTKAPK